MLKKINLLNNFIALIPFSIILGNLAININVLIICILGVITYGKKVFIIDNKLYQYLILSFFFYLILLTLIKNLPNLSLNELFKINIIKSILFLRFLILFFVVYKLIENKEFNLKIFFISCAFFSAFLALDIVIQVLFKKDLLGNEIIYNRASGFFGSEAVAGGYIQKFSFFFIFLCALKIKNVTNQNIVIAFLAIILIIIIIFTGNRMPLLIFTCSLFVYYLFEKKVKMILLLLSFSILLIFLMIKFPFINRLDIQIKNFYSDTVRVIKISPKLFYKNVYDDHHLGSTGYLLHFNSGVQLWKKNKIFGNGFKSLPLYCNYEQNTTCNTHPHNYFIEIIMDAGIVGIILIYFVFLKGLKNFYYFYFSKIDQKMKFISLPFFFIIFFEFFPLKSTGSFFTTSNAVIVFLVLAIFLNLEKLKQSKFYNI